MSLKSSSGTDIAESAFSLAPAEQEAVAAEARRLAQRMSSDEARSRYFALADAALAGAVPTELLAALESMLGLVLERQPLAQQVLLGVFQRTPRGRELAAAAHDVNAALRSLKGQPFEVVRLSATPGRYALVIETDRARLTLVMDAAGPRIESIETGG